MPRIEERQLVDVLSALKDVTVLERKDVVSDPSDDLFICALGFEDRCLTLPQLLGELGYRARRACYVKYRTNLDDNAINLPALECHLREISSTVDLLEADEPEFPNRLRSILDLVVSEAQEKPPRVTMDISVTANRVILRCIKVLFEYDVTVRIVYSEAEVYHPTKEEYAKEPEKWEDEELLGLERGVSDVTPSIDHPGAALDPLPDAVVLFPSFNSERSKTVIGFVDPSLLTSPGKKIVWLLGIPHTPEDHWRLEAVRGINRIGDDAPQYQVSTFDYKETLRTLGQLYAEMSQSHTITLSPLGSKMQALGAAIFCYMHPDVRVIFSMPKQYNAVQYTQGCKAIWKINLGSINRLRNALDGVGKLSVNATEPQKQEGLNDAD